MRQNVNYLGKSLRKNYKKKYCFWRDNNDRVIALQADLSFKVNFISYNNTYRGSCFCKDLAITKTLTQ